MFVVTKLCYEKRLSYRHNSYRFQAPEISNFMYMKSPISGAWNLQFQVLKLSRGFIQLTRSENISQWFISYLPNCWLFSGAVRGYVEHQNTDYWLIKPRTILISKCFIHLTRSENISQWLLPYQWVLLVTTIPPPTHPTTVWLINC